MRFLRILSLYSNRLKRIDHVAEKNRLEADFYNRWADDCLKDLDRQDLVDEESGHSPPRYRYFYSLIGDVKGKRILNLCCGDGRGSTTLARQGGLVFNLDIAWNMMRLARMRAEVNGVSDMHRFILTSAEEMGIRDCQFDLVVSLGALHHLQPLLAGQEIARVLKPGGRAIFLEALAESKLLLATRALMPVPCLESPGGGGLRYSDVMAAGQFFDRTKYREFLFLQRLLRFRWLRRFRGVLERLDSSLLQVFPSLRRYAAGIVVEFRKNGVEEGDLQSY